MASTYMDGFRNSRYAERDAAVSSENNACSQDVYNLERSIKYPAGFTDYLKLSIIIGEIPGAVLCFKRGFSGLIIGLVIGICVNIAIMTVWNVLNKKNTTKIRSLQDDRKKLCRERCSMHNQTCNLAIASEEAKYRSLVSKARKTYGGSTVIDPIIKFVADNFEVNIRAANREKYTSVISAELFFRAEETQLCILDKLPHSSQYHDTVRYDFFKNRFYNLTDFFDRVGFAQALSKRVEFEILRRFPADPITQSRSYKPKIEIDYDDTFMHLIYKVQNPNYRAAIDMRTGIGS